MKRNCWHTQQRKEPQKHYVKQEKPDSEDYILCDSIWLML